MRLIFVAALLGLVLCAVAVADGNDNDDNEDGLDLLNHQADRLRARKKEESKRNWAPVDSIFHAISNKAQKEEKKHEHVSQSPKDLGLNPFGLPDLNLVQGDDDWTPSGQATLTEQLQAAHAEQEKEKSKSDGLSGDHLLSSVGMEDDSDSSEDPTSDDFGELQLVQDDDSDWVPKGQSGMAQEIQQVHDDEEKEKLKSDGLSGDHLLSSAGLEKDEDEDDIQFMQHWHPKPLLPSESQEEDDTGEKDEYVSRFDKRDTDEEFDKLADESLGSDILGAVDLDKVKKTKKDGFRDVSTITADDIHI